MDVSDRRRFVLVWLGAVSAIVAGGAVVLFPHTFVKPVFLFGSPIDVIVNAAAVIVCGSIAVGCAVVGLRMWADRRRD